MKRRRFLVAAATGVAGVSTAGIAISRGSTGEERRTLPLRWRTA